MTHLAARDPHFRRLRLFHLRVPTRCPPNLSVVHGALSHSEPFTTINVPNQVFLFYFTGIQGSRQSYISQVL